MSSETEAAMLRQIDRASSYSHAEPNLVPGIGRIGGAPRAPLLDSFAPGHGINSKHVKGLTGFYDAGVQNTNGFSTWHSAMKVGPWEKGDTGAGQVTFAEKPDPASRYGNQREMSYRMLGVSIFNFHLHHLTEYRIKYGSMLDGPRGVMSHWSYIGVQQPQQQLLNTTNNFTEENNMIIGGRVRMFNIWLAQSNGFIEGRRRGHTGEMQGFWLLLRRHKYTGGAANDAAEWDKPVAKSFTRKRQRDQVRDDEDILRLSKQPAPIGKDDDPVMKWAKDAKANNANFNYLSNTLFPGVDPVSMPAVKAGMLKMTPKFQKFQEPEPAPTGVAPDQYYWSWDPFVSHTRTPPAPHLYMGDPQGDPNNQYIGYALHIGTMTHAAKGPSNYTDHQCKLARDALYPKLRNQAYLEPLHTLDEVEIMLRAGQVPA